MLILIKRTEKTEILIRHKHYKLIVTIHNTQMYVIYISYNISSILVATLNGFLYVAGGETTNDQYLPLKTVCRFDPRNSSWMQVASMQNCRQSFQLGVLNGALYAVGKL